MARELKDAVDYADDLRSIADGARSYIADEISPSRQRAWDYYNGNVDFSPPEDAARSDLVVTDVRDAVENAMPIAFDMLLRTGKVCEFEPAGRGQEAIAQQATDFCNSIFFEQNSGWIILHDALKDALTVKSAVGRAWFEYAEKTETYRVDIREDDLAMLAADPELEFDNKSDPDDNGVVSVDITRKSHTGKVRVRAERPEDLVVDGDSAVIDECRVVGFFQRKTISDIVAMNLPDVTAEDLGELTDGSATTDSDTTATAAAKSERAARQQKTAENVTDEAKKVPLGSRFLDFGEYWIRFDGDEDGNEELLHVVMVGPDQTVIYCEPVAVCPIVVGSVYRVPHQVIGTSIADLNMDTQDIKSAVVRGMLDNIALVNNPRKLVLLNSLWSVSSFEENIFNGYVPVKDLEAVKELETPFIGDKAIMILEYMQKINEMRTGISPSSLGLNPEAMRSMSEYYVSAVLGAPTKPLAMAIRVFAETFVGPLFQLILKLAKLHAERLSPVRVAKQLRTLDARLFPSAMPIKACVGLGIQSREEQVAAYGMLASKQEGILATMGPDNPYVGPEQYATTLQGLAKALGRADADSYFRGPAEAAAKQAQLQAKAEAQPSPPPDPDKVAKAQSITQKTQNDIMLSQRKQAMTEQEKAAQLQGKAAKEAADLQLKQRKQQTDAILSVRETDQTLSMEERLRRMEMMLEAMLGKRGQDIDAAVEVAIGKAKVKANGGGDENIKRN